MDFSVYDEKDLLQLQSSITEELLNRNVVRTKNNPLGDYTEWLVANALGLELQSNSKAGYDAVNSEGDTRFQVKGRRVTAGNKSRQLSAIRNYEDKQFDMLVAVIFDQDFNVIEAVQISHEVIKEYAVYRKHVNAHILILKGPILFDQRVKHIADLIRE